MSRPILSLDLPSSVRHRLIETGYRTVSDLEGMRPSDLKKELDITLEEALEIAQLVRPAVIETVLASQLLEKERVQLHISSGSVALDRLLGGRGITPGVITEFFGVPGIGKTQISIQLCVNSLIAHDVDSPPTRAIYIDTEGSFMARRAHQMCGALIDRLVKSNPASADSLTIDELLDRIIYFRVYDHSEFVALIGQLSDFIREKHVNLVAIDSIAFPFRAGFTDMSQRARQLSGVARTLSHVARDFDIAVVLINQMTTKVSHADVDNQESHLIPTL
ncbi:hypothetical protein H4R33_003836, partial [Dimargaris cristalligena]